MAKAIDAIELQQRMCALCNQNYSDEPCEPSDCVFVRAINEMPTIDPEALPIVRQLREELERVKRERDAALGRKVYVTARYDGDGLTVYRHDAESLNDSRCVVMVKYTAAAANVGCSENGKDGPYKTVMNVDEFGVLTMANDVARALFGYTESKEARP